MRTLSLTLGLCALLVACGGGGASTACVSEYWDGSIGTCLPEDWKVVEKSALEQRGVPPEVVVAFQAEQPVSGQFPTVTVTREALTEEIEPTQYSELSVQSVRGIPQYEEIDDREITIDDETVHLHIFSAQPREEEPKAKFYQVSVALGTTGYSYTAALPLGVEDDLEDQVLLILENATLLPPTEEEEG